MRFDWKITRYRKTQTTILEVFDPGGKLAANGSGKDIWEARENALANAKNGDVEKYILNHLFPDVD